MTSCRLLVAYFLSRASFPQDGVFLPLRTFLCLEVTPSLQRESFLLWRKLLHNTVCVDVCVVGVRVCARVRVRTIGSRKETLRGENGPGRRGLTEAGRESN